MFDWPLHASEAGQGFGLVTPDPFLRELSGVWAQDYILATLALHATVTENVQ